MQLVNCGLPEDQRLAYFHKKLLHIYLKILQDLHVNNGTTVLRYYGTTVLLYYGITVLRYYGIKGIWDYVIMDITVSFYKFEKLYGWNHIEVVSVVKFKSLYHGKF
jgi:hypothetical protein